jgi:hypothetical protein
MREKIRQIAQSIYAGGEQTRLPPAGDKAGPYPRARTQASTAISAPPPPSPLPPALPPLPPSPSLPSSYAPASARARRILNASALA